jgi:tRNA uridine 5-carboxymethylaminomethyl modification enzyme
LPDVWDGEELPPSSAWEVEIEATYEGYLERQRREIDRLRGLDALAIPSSLRFTDLEGISEAGRDLLDAARPASYGQACRVPGVSQTDLGLLAIALRRGG